MKTFLLGTRGSDLALAQTRTVAKLLRAAHPDLQPEERIIRTTGDVRLDVPLSAPGTLDKGLFTRELEDALLRGEIDAAVHSLKDMPTVQPDGLVLSAFLPRECPDDLLLSKVTGGLDALPAGAWVATSSLRRKLFLQWQRPDLEVVEIRGNVPTRIRKLATSSDLSALVLADAGIRRLEAAGCELDLGQLHLSRLPFMLPAPGQGAITVECRIDDTGTREILQPLNDEPTAICVGAERAVLSGLGGGCHLPLGTRATLSDQRIRLEAAWFRTPGSEPVIADVSTDIADWRSAVRSVLDILQA